VRGAACGYAEHMSDQETITCPECGDVFVSRDEFERHGHDMPLAWERGSTPFECPTCNASFDEAGQLVTHQAETHPQAAEG
jgi:uncharacterized C2H2 Zn-finger protein